MSVEDQYFKDFEKKDYDEALIILWEKHCAGQAPWPPPLTLVKKEIESRQRGEEGERR